jgi:hypothetical protein
MAHAQKPNFVYGRNGRVCLNRWGRQFSRLLAAELCASAVVMLDTPCSEVVWRVLATHSIRQFSLHFPSRASPCDITFQLDCTILFNIKQFIIYNSGSFWSDFWSQGKLYSWCSIVSRRITMWQNLFLGGKMVVSQLSRNSHLLQTPNIYYRCHKIPPLITYLELNESIFPHAIFRRCFIAPPPLAWRSSPWWDRDSFTITHKHVTFSRIPLDEWSARRRDLYLTTHNTFKIQTSKPHAGFESTIAASERP